MPVYETTSNRGYQKPHETNELDEDVNRIRAALDAIDADTAKGVKCEIVIACSDETTAITTGTAKRSWRMPFAMTVTSVKASMTQAPAGSAAIFDINESGNSILGTKLSVDAGQTTSVGSASPATITDSTLAEDAPMSIDFDQVGSSTAGAGVKIAIIGTRV